MGQRPKFGEANIAVNSVQTMSKEWLVRLEEQLLQACRHFYNFKSATLIVFLALSAQRLSHHKFYLI